ncbi:hypothetical protein LJR175_008218 [Variovorax sp. LjRoot175]|uniref:hypothetical protein n=1 Tax=Variovorax sp. LjRoot175 TaxID=3342276 RepID=UPI003ED10A7B
MSAKIHDAETQFLTIAVAKDIGLDQKGLVAQFDALNATRAELGLQPILIYSVVAPAFSRYVRMLVDARRPIPISQFLENAWSKEVNLGMPMSVQAKASLLANDLGFVSWIESLGIAVVPAASINCANAFERASQKLQASIQWNSHRYTAKPVALDAANASLLDHDAFSAFVGGARKSMYQYNYKSWDAREKSFSTRASIANDWNAAAIVEHPRTKLDPELKVRRYERRNSVPGINDVLSLWPKGRTVVLKDLNIRAQDFDLWIQGRCHLHPESFARLVEMLDLEFSDAAYVDDDVWEMGGGYLLVATSHARTVSAYDVLSHGGNLRFAFEVVGTSGERLASRVLLFAPWRGPTTIVLFARGTPVEKLLDERGRFDLQEPDRAPPEVWASIRKIVDRQLDFDIPGRVGSEFESAHAEWLESHTQKVW